MNIKSYKNKDGKTLYKFNVFIGTNEITGKKKYTNRQGFKSKRDAEIAYLHLKEKGIAKRNKKYTFQEVYEIWYDLYKNTVKESTLKAITTLFKLHILPELENYYVDKIDINIMQTSINTWHSKIVKFKEAKNYTSSVFKHAIRMGIISNNPCDLVILPKKKSSKNKQIKNYWDKEQLEIFLDCAEKDLSVEWYAFFRLLAFTGMRRGEALALHWEDINFENKTISINKNLAQGMKQGKLITSTKTTKSNRKITIDIKTLSILQEWKVKQFKKFKTQGQKIIFSNTKNDYTVLSFSLKKLNLVCDKNNLKRITVHGFRHTHCSLLFLSGASIKEVQDRLGHSDIKTTMDIYTHVYEEQNETTMNRLEKLLDF